MSKTFNLPSRIEPLDYISDCDLWIKRDDLIHPIINGNKWRKLKGFFAELTDHSAVLTFGGAYSNHLTAAAKACAIFGIRVIGVVRGQELDETSNAHLRYCVSEGMELQFVSRTEYKSLRNSGWKPSRTQELLWKVENAELLPEGGAGKHAEVGCGEIWTEITAEKIPQHLVLAAGTGATVWGIISAMPVGCRTKIHVVSAVKGAHREALTITNLAKSKDIQLHWEDEVHFGGFGKITDTLLAEKGQFEAKTGIPLDRNYNSKVLAYLNRNSWSGTVLWLHTGGTTEYE